MTPEERAAVVVQGWVDARWLTADRGFEAGVATAIAAAIREAVAAETTRCAELARTFEPVHKVYQQHGFPLSVREQIALAIEGREDEI